MSAQPGGGQIRNFQICPFLGQADDSETSIAFPSAWNYCHHAYPIEAINLDHQQNVCLRPRHQFCVVFQHSKNEALPEELRYKSSLNGRQSNRLWTFLAILVLATALFFGGWTLATQILSKAPGQAASSTLPIVFMDTATPKSSPPLLPDVSQHPTLAPATTTPAWTPSPSVIPTITREFHNIDTLIGLNYLFRIHRVRQGETMQILAFREGTSVAALHAVNYKLSTPLRPRQMIVVPIFQKDVSDLPEFEAYRVTENIALDTLALNLGVDVEELKYYNGLNMEQYVYRGEWLVVPRGETGKK